MWQSNLQSSIPFRAITLFLLMLTINCGFVGAFPFGKSSGVKELTQATLTQFLATHKPVFILFYAPWCGHCKNIHPEWEKFAKAVNGTVRVGALNADEHKGIAQQYGIRGFPTIKYWSIGEKRKVQDYEGSRNAAAIQAKAMSLITSDRVRQAQNADVLRDAVRAAPETRVAVLFSTKKRISPIFSVLSYSPRLQSMPFYFVGGDAKEGTAAEFGVSRLPSIVVLNATGDSISTVPYAGESIAYDPIAKFLLLCTANGDVETAESPDAPPATNTAAASRKPAMPVHPVRLTAQTFSDFCVPSTQTRSGRPPFCVVVLTPAFTLSAVHALFANEPFIFFEGHADQGILLDALRDEKLGLSEVADAIKASEGDQVLLIRSSKPDTVRFKVLDGIRTSEHLASILQKVVSGELALSKKKVS